MMNKPLAIVFPGQGSQSVGMLAEIANQFSEVKHTFAEASEVLGYDLWALTQEGPASELDQTTHTQPALLAASYAIWQILTSHLSIKPTMLAGHSLGEYTALVCANSLDFKEGIKLVAARGHYMQEAVPEGLGAMAAVIGLDEVDVAAICKAAANNGEVLSPANFNSIGQVVIAGHKEAVMRALSLAKEKGAKLTVLIPVSVPSHCDLMRPAADRLSTLLNDIKFKQPNIAVISNVDVKPYQDEQSIRDGLLRQLYNPVRWVETIQYFSASGINTIVECGPGKVLTGLNKRIDKHLQLMTTSDVASLQALAETEN